MEQFNLRDIERRRQLAKALIEQSGQEQKGQQFGRFYVPPSGFDQIARGVMGYYGKKEMKEADKQQSQLEESAKEAKKSALVNFLRFAQGAPEITLPEGQAGPVQPAQAPDMTKAFSALMESPDAQYQQAGMQGMLQIPEIQAKKEQRAADLEFRKQEAEAARQARTEALQLQHQQRMEALQAQNATREQMMQAQQEFQRQMAAERASSQRSESQPYFQPVQTAQGVMAFNARTGKMEPVTNANGQPVIGAQFDPLLQGNLAASKAGATTEAKARSEARIMAPQAIAQAEETVNLIDDLLKAPGFKQAVGGSRLFGIQKIPGTSAKDFDVRLDQLKGKQFLQAFESLKGGGQITEIEGKKATDAIARMDASSTEAEFIKAAREFQEIIKAGAKRAKNAAGLKDQPNRLRFDAQGNIIP
jgi:hypothetical protein